MKHAVEYVWLDGYKSEPNRIVRVTEKSLNEI